ncbi:MAG: potassium-transporting ATPase subunit F [Candidatus Dormiibacterota bacterium]
MNGTEVGYLIALVISILVTAYLVAAMLFPEKF